MTTSYNNNITYVHYSVRNIRKLNTNININYKILKKDDFNYII